MNTKRFLNRIFNKDKNVELLYGNQIWAGIHFEFKIIEIDKKRKLSEIIRNSKSLCKSNGAPFFITYYYNLYKGLDTLEGAFYIHWPINTEGNKIINPLAEKLRNSFIGLQLFEEVEEDSFFDLKKRIYKHTKVIRINFTEKGK